MAEGKTALESSPLYKPNAGSGANRKRMTMRNLAKHLLCRTLVSLRFDDLFRFLNRQKLLVVMYHGVTETDYRPPIWTQLPVSSFRQQLDYLRSRYTFISLSEFLAGIRGERTLPERAALLTFDDGLKNNFTVAFPILQKFSIPAAIFLTADYIGTDRFLWVDELYGLLRDALDEEKNLHVVRELAGEVLASARALDRLYRHIVEKMKRMEAEERERWLVRLGYGAHRGRKRFTEDFGFLSWEDVKAMEASGLVEFGVHTANHTILSHLADCELEKEVGGAKHRIEEMLNRNMTAFCYPNGIPNLDFLAEHRDYLKSYGFQCAFSTLSGLHSVKKSDHFVIKRVPVGSDITSDLHYFRLNAAGVVDVARRFLLSKGTCQENGSSGRIWLG